MRTRWTVKFMVLGEDLHAHRKQQTFAQHADAQEFAGTLRDRAESGGYYDVRIVKHTVKN